MNKLGAYISNLMANVVDEENNQFVRNLALSELQNLITDLQEFAVKHSSDDTEEVKQTEKKLLQEDK